LNFSIRRGWLVAVVGTVGSGKSSLLSACLGDLTRRSGTAELKGTTAYVPQTAWIQQQTLRDNICFGESLESSPSCRDTLTGKREWYDTVIKACALQTDLDRLSAGDKTEIGERGVNLSGGQRQRVSLARAVFQNCDVYLMDDPLSAVDSHVGKHLFDQVLGPDGLLKEKTRVVSTNAFHWLQQADWILVLNENGQLVQSGTYHTTFKEPQQLTEQDNKIKESDQWIQAAEDLEARTSSVDRQSSSTSDHFMVDEEILQGRVSMSAYISYLCDRGWLLSLLSILSYAAFLGVQAFGNYWIQWFADDRDLAALEKQVNNDTIWSNETERDRIISEVGKQTLHYLRGYSWIGLAQLCAMLCFSICHATSWIRASKVMHHKLLKRMLHAPAALFDRTPLGRILNRFSNDIENVDRSVPDALSEIISCVGDLSLCMIVVLISLKPPGMGLVIIIPLMIICGIIQSLYVPCSRQVRRLDAVTRSPLLANFGETAASTLGCSVMRAFGRTAAFVEHADELIDRNAVYGYLGFASGRWLDVTLVVS
uniref:ABC transmembrane type-1 domain-containing protein n=1 Tax=Echinostoma caproni TaxID=27848 RepID=A0A183AVF8_9TREM